jgi:hypothetical protein
MTDSIPDISTDIITDMETDIWIEIEILSWAQLNFSWFLLLHYVTFKSTSGFQLKKIRLAVYPQPSSLRVSGGGINFF